MFIGHYCTVYNTVPHANIERDNNVVQSRKEIARATEPVDVQHPINNFETRQYFRSWTINIWV